LHRRVVRAFSALDTGDALDSRVGQRDRAKNETASRRLLEREPRLDDLGIFFQRSGKGGVEGDGVGSGGGHIAGNDEGQ